MHCANGKWSCSIDYHSLPRKQLQTLCKTHGIAANSTNAAMANALLALSQKQHREESSQPPDKRVTRASHADAESGKSRYLKSSAAGEENDGDVKIGEAREHRRGSRRCMDKPVKDVDCEASIEKGQSNVIEDIKDITASEKHSDEMKDASTMTEAKKPKTSDKFLCKKRIKVRSPRSQSKSLQLKVEAAETKLESKKDKWHRKKGTVTFSDVIEIRVKDAETCTGDVQYDELVDRKTTNIKLEKSNLIDLVEQGPGTCTCHGLRCVSSSAPEPIKVKARNPRLGPRGELCQVKEDKVSCQESVDLCRTVEHTRGKTAKKGGVTKTSEDAGRVAVAEANELKTKQNEEYLPRRSRRLTVVASELNLNHITQSTMEDSDLRRTVDHEGSFVDINVSECKASVRCSRRLMLAAEEKVDNRSSITVSEEGCQVKTRNAIASKRSDDYNSMKPKQSQKGCQVTKPANRTGHKSTSSKESKSREADIKRETTSKSSPSQIPADNNEEESKQPATNTGAHTQSTQKSFDFSTNHFSSTRSSSEVTIERVAQDKHKCKEPFKQRSSSHKIIKSTSETGVIKTTAKANAKGKSKATVPSVKKNSTISIQPSFEEVATNIVVSADIGAKSPKKGGKCDTSEAIIVPGTTENQKDCTSLFEAQKFTCRTNHTSQINGEEEQNNSAGNPFHGLLAADPSPVSSGVVSQSKIESSHEDESLPSKCGESMSDPIVLDENSCSSAADMKDVAFICLQETASNQVHDKASENVLECYINEANKHPIESHQVDQIVSRTDDRALNQEEQDREPGIQSLEQDQECYVPQDRANLLEQEQGSGKGLGAEEMSINYLSENEKIEVIGEVYECFIGNTTRIEEVHTSKHPIEYSNKLRSATEKFDHDFGGFAENAARTEEREASEVQKGYSEEKTEDRVSSEEESYRTLDKLVNASESFAEYAAIAEEVDTSDTEDDCSEEESEDEGYSEEKSEENYFNKPLKPFSERLADVCGSLSEGDQETLTNEEEGADEEIFYSSEEEEYSYDEYLSMSEEEKDSRVDCSDKEERYSDREDSEEDEEWSNSHCEEEEFPSECKNDASLLIEEIENGNKIQDYNPDEKNNIDTIATHQVSDAIDITMGISDNGQAFLGINTGETSTNSSITDLLHVATPTCLEESSTSDSRCWSPSTNWTLMQLLERKNSPPVLVKNDNIHAKRLEETEVGKMGINMLGTNDNLDTERRNEPEEQEMGIDMLGALMNNNVDPQVSAEEVGIRILGHVENGTAASLDATTNEVSCLTYSTSLEESSSSLQCVFHSVDLPTCQTTMQLLKSNRDEKMEECSTAHEVEERSVCLVSADFQSGDNISPGALDNFKPQVEMSRDKVQASKTISGEDSLSNSHTRIQMTVMDGEDSTVQMNVMSIDKAEGSEIVSDESSLLNDSDHSQMHIDDGCRIGIGSSELKEKDVKQFTYEVHGVQSVFLEQARSVDSLANEYNSTCSTDDKKDYAYMCRCTLGITGMKKKEEKDLDEVEDTHGIREQYRHEIPELEVQAPEHDPSPESDAICNADVMEKGENIADEMEQTHDLQDQCVDEAHDLHACPQKPDNPSPEYGATRNVGLMENKHNILDDVTHSLCAQEECPDEEHDPSPKSDALCSTVKMEKGKNTIHEMEQSNDLQVQPQEPDNPSPVYGVTSNIGLMEKEQNILDEVKHSCGVQDNCLNEFHDLQAQPEEEADLLSPRVWKQNEADGQILESYLENPELWLHKQPTKSDEKSSGKYKLEDASEENTVSASCIPWLQDEKASGLAIKSIAYAEIPVHKFYSLPKPLQKPEELARKCEGVPFTQTGLSHSLEKSISSNAATLQLNFEGIDAFEVKMLSMDFPVSQSGLRLSNLSKAWQEPEGGAQAGQSQSISNNVQTEQSNSEGNDSYELLTPSMDSRGIQSGLSEWMERQCTTNVQAEQFNSQLNDALAAMAETPHKEKDDNTQEDQKQGISLAENTPIPIEGKDTNSVVSKKNQVSARKNISNDTVFPPRTLASGNKRLALKALPSNVSQTTIGGQATPSAKFQHTTRPKYLVSAYEGSSTLPKAAGSSSPQLPQAPRSSKRDHTRSHLLR